MSIAPKIKAVDPAFAIPGGDVIIECENFRVDHEAGFAVLIGGVEAFISTASADRVICRVPEGIERQQTDVVLDCGGIRSAPAAITIGREVVSGMHIVANPAIDPTTDELIVTRSGGRGQELPATLFRVRNDGSVRDIPVSVLNPTGIAFDREGTMFVTNRAAGELYAIDQDGDLRTIADSLGVATGVALGPDGDIYVGDRTGTVRRVTRGGHSEVFAIIEPSVAAFHMAFGPDGRLYVTAPGLASHDSVRFVDTDGLDDVFAKGFGRPQGIAFDRSGQLYAAASYRGRHGIVRISPDGQTIKHLVAGNNIVGLCFTRDGDMIVATNDAAYSIPCEIFGTLLD